MNANSQPPTPAINNWLIDAKRQLSNVGITSALLDAEIILAHTLKCNRTYLHAHPEQILDIQQCETADNYLKQRIARLPIAYIVGCKEFFGRQFTVTPATLIPRPESEDIITALKQLLPPTACHQLPTKLIDVGTGSGCLGITAKLEFPKLDVTLSDVSIDALKIAKKNAKKLSADVAILQSDLLQNHKIKQNIIIANLPYVDPEWDRSPETAYEPSLALFADNNGLSIINKIVDQAGSLLEDGGYLIIEADPIQHYSIIEYAKKHSLILIIQMSYILTFKLTDLSSSAVKK